MVVDEHLAAAREAREREHADCVTSSDDASGVNHSIQVDRAGEADLTAPGQLDRRSDCPRGRKAQAS
jgi:hypothetical protein